MIIVVSGRESTSESGRVTLVFGSFLIAINFAMYKKSAQTK